MELNALKDLFAQLIKYDLGGKHLRNQTKLIQWIRFVSLINSASLILLKL